MGDPVEIDRAAAWLAETVRRRRIGLLLTFGVVARVALYATGRGLWMDEASLFYNLARRPAARLFEPFQAGQLAPAGFFLVEWLLGRLLSEHRLVYRLFPLVCGIGSLWLFLAVARRSARPGAVWVALTLFAVSGDLVYYASELKPYGIDVAVALGITLAGLSLAKTEATAGRLAGFSALGAVAVWLSFPSAFVLAGVGAVLLAEALARRDWRRAAGLAATSASWAASFLGAFLVARRMLGEGGGQMMNIFWNGAFPPWPPGSWREALWPVRRLIYLFINPLDHHAPLGPWVSAAPAVALAAVGLVSFSRRDRRALAMLVLPVLIALAASYPRLYPFHGRLVLFVAPALMLLIGEGADVAVSATKSRAWRVVVLATVLLFPAGHAAYRLIEPRPATDHGVRQGDLQHWDRDPERSPF